MGNYFFPSVLSDIAIKYGLGKDYLGRLIERLDIRMSIKYISVRGQNAADVQDSLRGGFLNAPIILDKG